MTRWVGGLTRYLASSAGLIVADEGQPKIRERCLVTAECRTGGGGHFLQIVAFVFSR